MKLTISILLLTAMGVMAQYKPNLTDTNSDPVVRNILTNAARVAISQSNTLYISRLNGHGTNTTFHTLISLTNDNGAALFIGYDGNTFEIATDPEFGADRSRFTINPNGDMYYGDDLGNAVRILDGQPPRITTADPGNGTIDLYGNVGVRSDEFNSGWLQANRLALTFTNALPTITVDTNGAGVGATATISPLLPSKSDGDFVVRLICGPAVVARRPLFHVTYAIPFAFTNVPKPSVISSTNNAVNAGIMLCHIDGDSIKPTGFTFVISANTTGILLSTNDIHFGTIGR